MVEMANEIIVGMGQIGKALREIIGPCMVYDVAKKNEVDSSTPVDVMHVAFPHDKDFETEVKQYKERWNPRLTIIYSTVPIGTTERLQPGVVHSPIEGKHPDLEKSIRIMPRWIGSSDRDARERAVAYWYAKVLGGVRTVESADHTEFLKLRSTAKYGVNIAWADYEKSVADKIKMKYALIKRFDMDYNFLYEKLGMIQYQRYILDPPKGKIGGHCVVSNADILDEQYPNDMLKEIRKMG
jgi:hypothetical protein